jgi:Lrp/AsnC family leucine-responsive transcriptional regulator
MKTNGELTLHMADIDKIDRRILAILQGDGRIANVELAERIGLSPTSIGERLKRLQREGFIEGYGARLNPHRLGLGLLVFVEVLLDKTTPDIFERFARAVQNAPEVLECHMVAGGFDYLVKARLSDMTAYRKFLGERLLALPGVKETRTYAVMEEVKRDAPLPVG